MEFIIILFLLILNGIFAMYEIALVSSSKARLETLVSKGNKSAKGVLKQLEEPEKFLSTIQIGITLIGIISGAYGGVAIADDVTPLFDSRPGIVCQRPGNGYYSSRYHLFVAHYRRAGSKINGTEQSGTLCHPAQSFYDYPDKSILSVCLPPQCFNQTDKQAYRHERRGRTADDTGRTENDFASKFRAGRYRQRRD